MDQVNSNDMKLYREIKEAEEFLNKNYPEFVGPLQAKFAKIMKEYIEYLTPAWEESDVDVIYDGVSGYINTSWPIEITEEEIVYIIRSTNGYHAAAKAILSKLK